MPRSDEIEIAQAEWSVAPFRPLQAVMELGVIQVLIMLAGLART